MNETFWYNELVGRTPQAAVCRWANRLTVPRSDRILVRSMAKIKYNAVFPDVL
jgi:hypothetical protein